MVLEKIIPTLFTKIIAKPYLAILLLLLFGAALYLIYKLVHTPTPLGYGTLIALDHSKKQPGKVLFSRKYMIAGKPDYLIQDPNGAVIPIEYKSRSAPRDGPYKSYILQLASYCALAEEHYDMRPDYGVIAYANRSYKIPYTTELKREMLELNALVNKIERGELVPKPKPSDFCKYCSQRERCAGAR